MLKTLFNRFTKPKRSFGNDTDHFGNPMWSDSEQAYEYVIISKPLRRRWEKSKLRKKGRGNKMV